MHCASSRRWRRTSLRLSRASLCAEHRELIPRASNPCGLVVSDRERGWLVTLEEFWRLGQGLEEAAKWRRVSALKGFAR